jgi:hypothetical protein
MQVSGWPKMISYDFKISPFGLEALEAQEWHLAFAHKFDTFHLVMGLCSSWWCFLLPRCKWGEWDSCPFHHRDPDTYVVLGHVLIWSQRIYFYGCHVWHEWCEIPLIYIDGIWVSLHKGVSCLGYHELVNMWKFGGMVECLVDKTFFTYVKLKTIIVATPLWAKCEGEAHTSKSGKLESFGTPKNSECDCRGQIS